MVNARLGAAAGATGLLTAVAACASSGSAHAAGLEHFTATTADMSVIAAPSNSMPVKASGAFADAGTLSLSGDGTSALLRLHGGTISMSHGPGKSSQELNRANCHAILNEHGLAYRITGGTGRYAGITGSGTASLIVTAALPLNHGRCDASQSAVPTSARESFSATGPVRF